MEILEQGALELRGAECFGAVEEAGLSQAFGEHGVLEATIWLKSGVDSEKNSDVWRRRPVSLMVAGKDREYLFSGLLQSTCFKEINGRPAVQIRALSYTIMLDRQEKNRSYQQESRTFMELAGTILSPYQGSYIWSGEGGNDKVGRFLMQYQETDWSFLRRMASIQRQALVPEIRFPGAKTYIGLPEGRKEIPLEAECYHIRKRLAKVLSMMDNEEGGYLSGEFEIEVEDRYEDYLLGDRVSFQGRRLVVTRKVSRLKNSEWVHSYILTPESGCHVERIYNPRLAGAAIRGTVTETSLCANRLALVTDGEGEQQDSWHTQPVYYAGGGKGYSGQPEKGDDQYLYFPTMREENRYILGCVDAGEEKIAGLVEATADEKPEEEEFGGVSGQAVSPGISTTDLATSGVDAAEEKSKNLSKTKNWSTPGRRMLVLSETGVVLAEGSRNRLSVQNWGIRIKSNNNLNLTADEDLFANTRKISMEAGNYIWLQSGQSGMLLLPDQIQMSSPKIHLASPLNKIHPLKVRTDVEAVLAEYEKRKKSYPPLIAPDGSVIRREGYEEILGTEELWNYFIENVAGKDDRYPLKEDTPIPTLYEQWLDDTYGKTQMGQFWEYMCTVDGLQSVLDVIGLVWPPADIANAIIYLCRGQYDKALWSAVFSIPALGDLLGIGKLGKFGKGLSLADLGKSLDNVDEMLRIGGELDKPFSFADWMTPEDAKKYLDFLENGSTAGLTRAELEGIKKLDELQALNKIDYQDILDMRKADDVFKGGSKLKIEEVIPPGSTHPVKVYTDGNAQINTGKIDTYIRGKVELDVEATTTRIDELKDLRKSNPKNFTKEMKKELQECEDRLHNYQRSQEMSNTLNTAGIEDTIENNQMIVENLFDAAKEVTEGNTEIISYIEGVNGKVQVVSRWKILPDGTPYLATVILKPVK